MNVKGARSSRSRVNTNKSKRQIKRKSSNNKSKSPTRRLGSTIRKLTRLKRTRTSKNILKKLKKKKSTAKKPSKKSRSTHRRSVTSTSKNKQSKKTNSTVKNLSTNALKSKPSKKSSTTHKKTETNTSKNKKQRKLNVTNVTNITNITNTPKGQKTKKPNIAVKGKKNQSKKTTGTKSKALKRPNAKISQNTTIPNRLISSSQNRYLSNSIGFMYGPLVGNNIQTTQGKANKALMDLKKAASLINGNSKKDTNKLLSQIQGLGNSIIRTNNNLTASAKRASTAEIDMKTQIQNLSKKIGNNINLKFSSISTKRKNRNESKEKELSYEELNKMKYSQLIEVLGNKVLSTPVLQHLKEPLDDKDTEIPSQLRTKNMFQYKYRIVNAYDNEFSVCEGAAYWNPDVIVYCDVNTRKEKGIMRFMHRKEIYDQKKGRYDRTALEISNTKIQGHSNDITVIPEDKVILQIDDKKNSINVYKVDKNYKATKTKTIKDIKANGIAYDKKTKEVVIVHATDAEYYTKDDLLNSNTKPKPEEKFKIPDKIKDKKNSTYYNYIQGIAAEDGLLYVSYSGFNTDKDKYGAKEDKVLGNMIVTYDYKKEGKAIGRTVDNVKVEIEGFDFDEKGDLVAFYNGGHWTRVFKTDLVNSKDISEKYKASKSK